MLPSQDEDRFHPGRKYDFLRWTTEEFVRRGELRGEKGGRSSRGKEDPVMEVVVCSRVTRTEVSLSISFLDLFLRYPELTY